MAPTNHTELAEKTPSHSAPAQATTTGADSLANSEHTALAFMNKNSPPYLPNHNGHSVTQPDGAMLPAAVESVRIGWIVSAADSGIIALVFIIIEALVLQNQNITEESGVYTAFLALGYIGMSLNAGGVISAWIVLDMLNETPVRAWKLWRGMPGPPVLPSFSESKLLQTAGLGLRWRLISGYLVFTIPLGCGCVLAQLAIAGWAALEHVPARWAVIVVTIWASLPLVGYFLSSFLIGFLGME